MNHDLTVSKSILINANTQKVWEALTQPEIIKQYLFGTETITDWKVGSTIIFQGEYEGQVYKDQGIIIENTPLSKLSYSYWSGFSGLENKLENYSTIIYTLVAKTNEQTEFTWTQKGYANAEGYKHSEDGMLDFLRSIKAIIEK